jgi:AraC-like DNA-binding protein
MVCHRCKIAVKSEIEKAGLHPVTVALGEVGIEEKEIKKEQLHTLSKSLGEIGFELIDDRRTKMIEQIKTFIIEQVHYKDDRPEKNYSALLSQHLHHEYSYISNLFSEVEGLTIERYILNQKIEKVKELITYDELSLSQIAFKMGYSSTAHLSSQFKKVTGFTATEFRKGGSARRSLDEIRNTK